MATLRKVISGGQTGVDRAALAAARAEGLSIGGWCPPGRASEAGPIPPDLPLTETPAERSADAPDVPRLQRTEWNVSDADATLVLSPAAGSSGSPGSLTAGPDDPGTAWAVRCAERYGRPLLVVSPDAPSGVRKIVRWLADQEIATLNVAGPSEGTCPGSGERAFALLSAVFEDAAPTGNRPLRGERNSDGGGGCHELYVRRLR